jgi:phosphate uptake regulator
MGMTQIEDINGDTAEVNGLGEHVELSVSDDDHTCSLVLTPRQARAIARQLLEQADAVEYGE